MYVVQHTTRVLLLLSAPDSRHRADPYCCQRENGGGSQWGDGDGGNGGCPLLPDRAGRGRQRQRRWAATSATAIAAIATAATYATALSTHIFCSGWIRWARPLGGCRCRRSRPCRSDRHALLILRRAPKTLGFLVFGLPLPQTTSPSPHRGARHEPLRGGAGPPSGCHPPTLVYDSKTDLDRAGHQASQYVIGRKSTRMDDTGRRGSDHSTIHMLREPPAADGGQRKIDMGRR
jgi:hypothetical protein